jgi:hypothetical protein
MDVFLFRERIVIFHLKRHELTADVRKINLLVASVGSCLRNNSLLIMFLIRSLSVRLLLFVEKYFKKTAQLRYYRVFFKSMLNT